MAKPVVFEVSHTKIALWRRCRMAYHYRYVRRLQPRVKGRPLRVGTLVHVGLEAIIQGKRHLPAMLKEIAKAKIFDEEKAMLKDEAQSMAIVLDAYQEFWRKEPIKYVEVNGRLSEHELRAPLVGGKQPIDFIGYVDNVGVFRGVQLLIERKTGSFDAVGKWWDNQTTYYAHFWPHKTKFPIDGVLWDMISTKTPTEPKPLQRGGLSIQAIDTLPAVVLAIAEKHGMTDHESTKTLLERAHANLGQWFQRKRTNVRKAATDSQIEDLIRTAQEIQENGYDTPTRTLDRHCGWCDFAPLCEIHFIGGDQEDAIERGYVQKDRPRTGKKAKP